MISGLRTWWQRRTTPLRSRPTRRMQQLGLRRVVFTTLELEALRDYTIAYPREEMDDLEARAFESGLAKIRRAVDGNNT